MAKEPKTMTLARTNVILATALAASLGGVAAAENLHPMQAGTLKLNDWAASVYYIDSGSSYEVVVTLATLHGEERVPIRLTTQLQPGERNTVVVGSFDMSEDPAVLEIERTDDGLSVNVPPPTAQKAKALTRSDGEG
jgi:hypothetical protein